MDENNLNWHEDTKNINKPHKKKKLPAANLSIKNSNHCSGKPLKCSS